MQCSASGRCVGKFHEPYHLVVGGGGLGKITLSFFAGKLCLGGDFSPYLWAGSAPVMR